MQVHLQKEMTQLKQRIVALSALVEENLRLAVKSVEKADIYLAEMICARDREVDAMEVEIEEDCLKILALHQPVATDLRFIIAVLKMNNDLERIGDLAVNVAERAGRFSAEKPMDLMSELTRMAACARSMLRRSLDSVVNLDLSLAREVLADDDEVDAIYHGITRQVRERLSNHAVNVDELLQAMVVAKQVERVADLATNIAEDAIYMVEGRIVRHGRDAC
ncbi:MAG: phosphate signaling complex protein PhoU [Candidatus Krumholzibacteriia bacterium]